MEFEKTDSSKLTIEEFDTKHIDLEQEMDPPCYTEGLRKAKLAQVNLQQFLLCVGYFGPVFVQHIEPTTYLVHIKML